MLNTLTGISHHTQLKDIDSPADIRSLAVPDLVDLAQEIRDLIIRTVSRTGVR